MFSTSSQPPQQPASNNNQASLSLGGFASSTATANPPQQQSSQQNAARIDIEHLRPSTRYDQLTEALQKDLEAADQSIATQMHHCEELEVALIPKVKDTGALIPGEVEFITRKLENVQDGLGFDAEDEQYLENWVVKKDTGELRLVSRNVERLKAPRQYQIGPGNHAEINGMHGATVNNGSFNPGTTGWWNNPQTMRGSLRATTGAHGVQLPPSDDQDGDDSIDPSIRAPKSLVELFERRAEEMYKSLDGNKRVLAEVEEHVGEVDEKVRNRERELFERQDFGSSYGPSTGKKDQSAQAGQRRLLNLAFEEAHRSLYEVAAKVSELREGLIKARTTG